MKERRLIFTDFIKERMEETGLSKTKILTLMAESQGLSSNAFFYLLTTDTVRRDHHQVIIKENGDINMIMNKFTIPAEVLRWAALDKCKTAASLRTPKNKGFQRGVLNERDK